MLEKVNIAILEDNIIFLQRISKILRDWERVECVFECSTNYEFECIMKSEKIDILLADINLSEGNGIDSIDLFSKSCVDGISIVISSQADSATILRAISMGAVGYLHKEDSSLAITGAIDQALAGGSPISPNIANRIFTIIQKVPLLRATEASREPKPHVLLTKRETEVLSVLAKGLSYGETAEVLKMSKKTVPVHVRRIYKKLQSNNRTEAVYEARLLGLLD